MEVIKKTNTYSDTLIIDNFIFRFFLLTTSVWMYKMVKDISGWDSWCTNTKRVLSAV